MEKIKISKTQRLSIIQKAIKKVAIRLGLTLKDYDPDWEKFTEKVKKEMLEDLKNIGVKKIDKLDVNYKITPRAAYLEFILNGKKLLQHPFTYSNWDSDIEKDPKIELQDSEAPLKKQLGDKEYKLISETKMIEGLNNIWENREQGKYPEILKNFAEEASDKSQDLIQEAKAKKLEVLKAPNITEVKDGEGKTALHILAEKGVSEVLKHPNVAMYDLHGKQVPLKDNEGLTPLHHLARVAGVGNIDGILKNPYVAKVHDKKGKTPLHYLGEQNRPEIISHPEVAKVEDKSEWTPLHELAFKGNSTVLEHPSMARVKDLRGNTPLHYLAIAGNKDILDNPNIIKAYNKAGETPLHLLVEKTPVKVKEVKKLFKKLPAGYHDNDKLTSERVTDLLKG